MFNQPATVLRHGLDLDTTPIDTLMSGTTAMHLAVYDSMTDDGDYADDDTASGFGLLGDREYA